MSVDDMVLSVYVRLTKLVYFYYLLMIIGFEKLINCKYICYICKDIWISSLFMDSFNISAADFICCDCGVRDELGILLERHMVRENFLFFRSLSTIRMCTFQHYPSQGCSISVFHLYLRFCNQYWIWVFSNEYWLHFCRRLWGSEYHIFHCNINKFHLYFCT